MYTHTSKTCREEDSERRFTIIVKVRAADQRALCDIEFNIKGINAGVTAPAALGPQRYTGWRSRQGATDPRSQ